MTFDGAGTMNSPIFIQDSEEEIIQELSYQQFYGSSSSTASNDTTQSAQYSTHQHSSMAGKRKSREDDESMADARSSTLTPSTSLENRISQPEGKKARKRRRRAEREALERNKSQNAAWLDNLPVAGPSQPAPPLQARVKAERQYPNFHDGVLRENQTDMGYPDYVPPSSSSSTFDSDWVSSMVIAGEFPHCKEVKTSIKLSPRPAPRPLPAFPLPLPPPKVLPPIHIHPDLMVSTEAPAPTHAPQQVPPPKIGMEHEKEPKGKHGIFHITDLTMEAGSRMNKRKNPYIPNPARTLVMEKLPKAHRTTDFVTNWCLSACGVLPHHIFVDPPSAKALIEFCNVELARKAWAGPRLGQTLLGKKPSLLKGMPREDQIRVWWYRDDGVRAGVREIEEGEIDEDRVTEKRATQPPSSPRKESKKERKAKLVKQRETKATKNQQLQKEQKNFGNSSPSVPPIAQPASSVNVSTPAQAQATSSQAHIPPAQEVPPASLYPPTQPWQYPLGQSAQSATNSYFPTPSPFSTTVKTGIGSSLAPGARGGHDDSASIASSGGRSSPECHWSRKTAVVASSSKLVVEARTNYLPDYTEGNMNVDRAPFGPATSETATSSTHASMKAKTFTPQSMLPSRPRFISGTLREKPRSKQTQPHLRSHIVHTPNLATMQRPAVPPSILNDHLSHQLPQSSPVSSPSAGLPPIPPVSNSSQRTPFSSIPSRFFPSVPISPPTGPKATAHSSKHSVPVRSKLDKPSSKSKMGLVQTTAGANRPSNPVSVAPASFGQSTSSSHSVGQEMEENLRQLVFASKRARVSSAQSRSSQGHSSTSADVNMTLPVHNPAGKVLPGNDGPNRIQAEESNKRIVNSNMVETLVSAPSSAMVVPPTSNSTSVKQSTIGTFSFEDLAVTFITQTIENVKANNFNQHQPDPHSMDSSSSTSTLSSASQRSSTPSGSASSNALVGAITPDELPPAVNSSILSKSELSAKQNRLEKHLQESRILMERLSTAKTKREKDLLLKIMNEKMRLFEEETKASEKKPARVGNPESISIKKSTKGKMQTTTLLHFQQWPTIPSNPILVLSDDED